MTFPVSSRAHADLALAIYLEPHAEGRRVLLLGEAHGELADRFDRLAQQLEIIDPTTRQPSDGEVPELPFDDRSFELVLVCDAATLPDPTDQAIRELRRVLARGGLLVVASRAQQGRRRRRGPPLHVSLENMLSAEFREVRVLAQTPLAGYALGERERQRGEEFAVDSSLVRERPSEPERLLALASDALLPNEPRLWVELPPPSAEQEEQAPAELAPASLVEELRRAEDEAREALHRESDLLRELELERRARTEAEQVAERVHMFERKLLAAEADYDDAVARVRYFESAIGEHEAATLHERERREASERELAQARAELAQARERLAQLESERDAAQAAGEALAREHEALEQQLVLSGRQVLALEQDKKHHERTARDLLEELRRLEHDKSASVEHDARVAELEAERDRAVQRALEAEVAREAAQMRADELRAELAAAEQSATQRAPAPAAPAPSSEGGHERARLRTELARARGERRGLALRLDEAELALLASGSPGEQLRHSQRQLREAHLRLAHNDALLHSLRDLPARESAPTRETPSEASPELAELEEQLAVAASRVRELTRELEEADRFAELHAEDAERLASVEAELEAARARIDDLEDEVRAADDELRAARTTIAQARSRAEQASIEAAVRLEIADKCEAEREDARAALAEARSILSQLALRVGADENDPPSIVQALLAQREAGHGDERVESLRGQLALRDQRIEQLERWLADARGGDGVAADVVSEPREH